MKTFLISIAIICLAWVVIFYNIYIGIVLGTIGFTGWIVGIIKMDKSFLK